MKVVLDRINAEIGEKPAQESEAGTVTLEIGGVRIDIRASRANGRPALLIRSVDGQLSVVPNASNTIYIIAYSDIETVEHARADRAASQSEGGGRD